MIKLFEGQYHPMAGGATTGAITKSLNGTSLSDDEVLLRESIQNSYDAKIDNNKPLDVFLNCSKFTRDQAEYLRELFGTSKSIGQTLVHKINPNFYNIEIVDRNTTGLSGYGGFKEGSHSNEEEKFHHFVYMMGNDSYKNDTAGGSFGFGKAALYKYSDLRTIIIYTRVKNSNINKYETRLIICRIDERIKDDTGRCWWGTEGHYESGLQYAKPLLNEDADEVAKKIGMQSFKETDTGTNILILKAKDSNEETIDKVFKNKFPLYILHWFWPKTITPNQSKKIDFSLSFESKDISYLLLDPFNVYPYSTFSRTFINCCNYNLGNYNDNMNIYHVESNRPKVEIGNIFLRTSPITEFEYNNILNIDWNKPTVALMRDVEFIVEYVSVNIDTNNSDTTCFGIFHTNHNAHSQNSLDEKEIEHYFRDIENQTHDKWTHKETFKTNYYKKVTDSIPEAVRKILDINDSINCTSSISGIIAQKLGTKLGFGFGSGASIRNTTSNKTQTSSSPKKSTFKRSSEPINFKIENNKKIIEIKYEAKILPKKKLILELKPLIKSNDPHETLYATPEQLILKEIYCSMNDKDNTVMIYPIKNNFVQISKSGIYTVKIQANIQCAYDISITKEEIDV